VAKLKKAIAPKAPAAVPPIRPSAIKESNPRAIGKRKQRPSGGPSGELQDPQTVLSAFEDAMGHRGCYQKSDCEDEEHEPGARKDSGKQYEAVEHLLKNGIELEAQKHLSPEDQETIIV
jgi:hypothetical protein